MCINLIKVPMSSFILAWFMTIKAVLSWGVTPFSGSFKLDSGPTALVVRLGMAAANILVSHIQMATLRDNASRDVLRVCVFSSVFEIMELTRAAVWGPIGGERVKWPSRQIRAAEKHRSSMDSPVLSSPVPGVGDVPSASSVIVHSLSPYGLPYWLAAAKYGQRS